MIIFICVCREADITKERIQKILSAGTNVILTTGGIDDLCLKYFVESGTMAVRRCKKIDLRRIAKATGGEQAAVSNCTVSVLILFSIMFTMFVYVELFRGVHFLFDDCKLGAI